MPRRCGFARAVTVSSHASDKSRSGPLGSHPNTSRQNRTSLFQSLAIRLVCTYFARIGIRFSSGKVSADSNTKLPMPTNVLGTELKCCCRDPMTGFYRDGYCRTGSEDVGQHTVCVQVTEEFLDFSVLDGNDLVTPRPEWGFLGLKPGDKWCVCVTRWKSALDHNRAAPVDLKATHASALEFVTLEELKAHAVT